MTYYKAIITDTNSPQNGESIGSTKAGTYKGLSLEDFTRKTKYATAYKIQIVQF